MRFINLADQCEVVHNNTWFYRDCKRMMDAIECEFMPDDAFDSYIYHMRNSMSVDRFSYMLMEIGTGKNLDIMRYSKNMREHLAFWNKHFADHRKIFESYYDEHYDGNAVNIITMNSYGLIRAVGYLGNDCPYSQYYLGNGSVPIVLQDGVLLNREFSPINVVCPQGFVSASVVSKNMVIDNRYFRNKVHRYAPPIRLRFLPNNIMDSLPSDLLGKNLSDEELTHYLDFLDL